MHRQQPLFRKVIVVSSWPALYGRLGGCDCDCHHSKSALVATKLPYGMQDLTHSVAGLRTMVKVQGSSRPFINLDNAASTPPLISVLKAVNDFVPLYAAVHRGSGYKSEYSTAAYEAARRTVLGFFGANESEHVAIFGKNTTEALNKLSYRLRFRKTDVVLISHLEHHSNDLPWRARATVKRIQLTADGGIDKNDFMALLGQYAGRVKLVALSGGSNVTGHIPDIHWFARKAHEAGAHIAIDCAQLAAHRPIHMGTLSDPEHLDYVAVSAHKMYAPFGSGALIGRRDTFLRGEPEYSGGGTISLVTAKSTDWALPPDSDEAGSPNVLGAIAFAEALRTLQTLDLSLIAKHETLLTTYALVRLREVPGLRLYGSAAPSRAAERLGVIPFTIDNYRPHLIAAILGTEWGIGVRSGCFCAQPYVMSLLSLDRSAQHQLRYQFLHGRRDLAPGMVRISFGMYNTLEDIDALVLALKSIVNGEHKEYVVDKTTGLYTPAPPACPLQAATPPKKTNGQVTPVTN